MIKQFLTAAVAGLLFALASQAQAHSPGVSVAELDMSDDRLQAHVVFARRDIETLVSTDLDAIGELNPDMPALRELGDELLEVNTLNRRIYGSVSNITFDDSDGVHFYLEFTTLQGSLSAISVPVLARMNRGHRQYFSLKTGGALRAEAVLSATAYEFEFELQPLALQQVFVDYVGEGMRHIGIGFDHILFLITLLLPAVLYRQGRAWLAVESLRPAVVDVIRIVTAFTLAHSVTLTLAAFRIVALPPRWVESAIAASVVLVALNNVWPLFRGSRWMLAFAFGLLHGFGFAGVLSELGVSMQATALSIVGFNVGVELGQLAIVLVLFPLAYWFRAASGYDRWLVKGGSLAAAALAGVWLVERVAAG